MLHRDTSARFEKSGFSLLAQYRLTLAGEQLGKRWNAARAKRLLAEQKQTAVAIFEDQDGRRTWWLFRDEIYWEDDGLSALEVKALALERLTKQDRHIRRAIAMMEQAETMLKPAREPIPDDVKVFVWNRDGGRCVRCRGNERLEFDHIIPLAMGGANTARNLQLLCEGCNRAKGASLT